jgi:hypothetical protein
MYSLIHSRILSRGRYGRSREIIVDLPDPLIEKIRETVMLSFDLRG